MKNISKLIPCIIGGMIFLNGCGASIPDLSEEQNQLVTEYAAGLLLKYDKNYQNMLVDTAVIIDAETLDEDITPEESIKDDNNVSSQISGNESVISESEEVISNNEVSLEDIAPVDIAKFLGLDGISIDYTGNLVCDTYPGDLNEELFLDMAATENHKLVVFMFDVTNLSLEEKSVDLLTIDTRYRFYINDSKQNNALTTMLPDDLSTFNDILQPNETKKLVLVIEVLPEITENITDLSLVIKLPNDSATILLQP